MTSEILHEIRITDVALGGDGVGRLADGRAVFVPFTLPGETVTVRLVTEQARFCRAEVTAVTAPAAARVIPPCPLFGRCGGCQYQHAAYPLQVELKQKQLRETLRRIGGFAELPEPEVVAASPQPFAYRNKLRLEPPAAGAPVAGYGFFARDNTTLLPVPACPLAMPSLNALLPEMLRDPAAARNLTAPYPVPLTLRQPAVGPAYGYFDPAEVSGRVVEERLDGRPVRVPAAGFWQVNPAVAARLLETVGAWYAAAPTPTLVDAYAGAGAFMLTLGASAARRILIEADPAAVAAARDNLAYRGLSAGAECLAASAETALPRRLKAASAADRAAMTVVLDPPRGGCAPELLAALSAYPPGRIFYVSCHPATLSRDLRKLCTHGGGPWQLARYALFDMFPQTAHFETAVELVPG